MSSLLACMYLWTAFGVIWLVWRTDICHLGPGLSWGQLERHSYG